MQYSKIDSAKYFLRLRASLDTLNASWQYDAGQYHSSYDEELYYYKKALRIYQSEAELGTEVDKIGLIRVLSALANTYLRGDSSLLELDECDQQTTFLSISEQLMDMKDRWSEYFSSHEYEQTILLSESEQLYNEALGLFEQLDNYSQELYKYELFDIYHGLSDIYQQTDRISESILVSKKAIAILKQIANNDPEEYAYSLILNQIMLAKIYCDIKQYSESEQSFNEALETCLLEPSDDLDPLFNPKFEVLYGLSQLYMNWNRLEKAEEVITEMLNAFSEYYESLSEQHKSLSEIEDYELSIAYSYYNDELRPALYFVVNVLDLYRQLVELDFDSFGYKYALAQFNNGRIFATNERYHDAEDSYKKALMIFRQLANADPETFNINVFKTTYNLGIVMFWTHNYQSSLDFFEEALELSKIVDLNTSDSSQVQLQFYNLLYLSSAALYTHNFEKAEQYARKSMSINSTEELITRNLATSLLFQGKYDEAEAIYRQYKDELKDDFLQNLQDFEAAGVIPEERKADVEKIKQMLNK